ncbi:MAG TPA: class I SAM-dependent methyltransferase [Casimicrobiaceae bacterium]|nr:class I SAM-dependent methyltransferase [Casimicrobiaceae bacterium]
MTTSDFDARAATWDDDPTKVERAQAVADAIVARVPLAPTMRALEYGCGTGLLSFMLRARLGDITLADVSEGMLAVAARKIIAADDASMRTVRLDYFVDPVPARAYDIVYSLMTLHHIPDTAGILERFRTALAAAGFLCIADLDTEDGSFHGAGFDGHLGFDRTELAAKARRAGFTSVEFTTAYTMTKAVGSGHRSFPVFLMVAS